MGAEAFVVLIESTVKATNQFFDKKIRFNEAAKTHDTKLLTDEIVQKKLSTRKVTARLRKM